MTPHLSRLALERRAAGERDAAADAHVAACDRCRARAAAIERDTARFRREIDVAAAVDALVRAARFDWAPSGELATRETLAAAPVPRHRRPWRAGAVAGALALGAVAGLVIGARDRGAPLVERPKGTLGLEVIRREVTGRIGVVTAGDRVHPGEAIRFRVARDRGFLVILGIDAAHAVTPYSPIVWLDGRGPVVLEGSIVLDDTLGAERIVAIVCDWPLPVDALVSGARRELARVGGDPRRVVRAAAGCREASIVIEKVRE